MRGVSERRRRCIGSNGGKGRGKGRGELVKKRGMEDSKEKVALLKVEV